MNSEKSSQRFVNNLWFHNNVKAFKKKSSRRRHVPVCQDRVRSLLIQDGLDGDEATEAVSAPPLPPGESEEDSEDDIPKIRDKSKTRECPICKKVSNAKTIQTQGPLRPFLSTGRSWQRKGLRDT